MKHALVDQSIFVTWVASSRQRECARLLIDTIRAFGGGLSHCPIWVFEANPQRTRCESLEQSGVRVLPLGVPEPIRRFHFSDKVYACARAEEMAPSAVQSLVWLSPDCLIVRPPLLFDLAPSIDAAVRPVHIQNVGLPAAAPLDAFWQGIYETIGIPDVEATVESFVDRQRIRAYFNSASFAARPSAGLFRQWLACFEALVLNEEYLLQTCQDEWHQVFLHQAILSTLIVTTLDPERVRILPPDYGYPYNLHQSVPPERRASALNDLTCVIYEERLVDPDLIDDIEVREPLRSWLSSRTS